MGLQLSLGKGQATYWIRQEIALLNSVRGVGERERERTKSANGLWAPVHQVRYSVSINLLGIYLGVLGKTCKEVLVSSYGKTLLSGEVPFQT